MPTHAEKKLLPYTREQLFDLVADVERYPEFLPWCMGARIRERSESLLVADLIIGFKFIRERFTSRVVLEPGQILPSTSPMPTDRSSIFRTAGVSSGTVEGILRHRFLCRIRIPLGHAAKADRRCCSTRR